MKKPYKYILRTLLCVFTPIIVLASGAFGALAIVNIGPSAAARDLFVVSMTETSMGTVFARIFFSQEEIDTIVKANSLETTDEEIDTGLIEAPQVESPDVTVEDISGSTYKGKLISVSSASRVKVGVCGEFPAPSKTAKGKTLQQIAERYDALAAINGGYFYDPDGLGKGGVPEGLVISDGKMLYGSLTESYEVIGFDYDNVFITQRMTGKQALDKGIRDAVCFGPSLIVNGEPMQSRGVGSGLNPRTAIGQRADGTVLLLVLEGRQPGSLGATYTDVIDILLAHGAVNAANLDGGTSSVMVWEGKYITSCCSLYGPREIPTAFIVEK